MRCHGKRDAIPADYSIGPRNLYRLARFNPANIERDRCRAYYIVEINVRGKHARGRARAIAF